MEFLKLNIQSFRQLQNVASYLAEVEAKGKSVSYLYHAGITLDAVLQQIIDDNKETENNEVPKVEE